jgi:hypothetical protein
VLAASAALTYEFGGGPASREKAERFADLAVNRYETAAIELCETIDRRLCARTGQWFGDRMNTPSEPIEREHEGRRQPAWLSH